MENTHEAVVDLSELREAARKVNSSGGAYREDVADLISRLDEVYTELRKVGIV